MIQTSLLGERPPRYKWMSRPWTCKARSQKTDENEERFIIPMAFLISLYIYIYIHTKICYRGNVALKHVIWQRSGDPF